MSLPSNAIPGAVSRRLVSGGNSPVNVGGGGFGALAADPPQPSGSQSDSRLRIKGREFLVAELAGQQYVLSDDLRDVLPAYFTSKREKAKNAKWTSGLPSWSCSKVLVTRDWLERELDNQPIPEPQETGPLPSAACGKENAGQGNPTLVARSTSPQESLEDTEPVEDNDESLAPAPDLVSLTDAQKWSDEDGKPVELETRGELTKTGLLFRAADVAKKLLGTTPRNLRKTIYDGDAFVPDEDFIRVRQDNVTTIYVTFSGVVRLLYRSRRALARRFTDWATEKLFVLKAGDDNDRAGLAGDILGVPLQTALTILNKCPLPCAQVYLLTLGTVGKLRETMTIANANAADDHIVVKIGATTRGAATRISEHRLGLGRIKNVDLRFVKAIWTDPLLLFTCEAEVKQYFQSHADWIFRHSGWETWRDGKRRPASERSEIFVIPAKELDTVQKLYDAWQAKFGGGYADLLKTNEALQEALRQKGINEAVLADVHNERIRSRDIEIAACHREIAGRDREIAGRDRESALLKQHISQAEELHQLKMDVLRSKNA
ncbi:hypothetical protein HDU87_002648 [Geranomyces variabilis]|uniref:Bro-N domain-containing protein n=1 Tax=Geranomyces variabilis TaxID=109894 RepID=A0AAD5TUG9_9FUNG|nr:hypothetical protein HDU87_002648 [Geranomyces variabilis]